MKQLMFMKTFLWCSGLLLSISLTAQQQVTGVVQDEDGTPLIGVNILEQGTTNGTVTDYDGSFQLDVGESARLVFSYTGYQTLVLEVGTQSTVNAVLQQGALLDEVVVVGYGTRKKSDLTGSLVSVTTEDFDKQPLTRIDQALQGRSAGVQVTQTSGAPGAGYKIRIRGANSINGNNNPLYVVDGMVVGSINALNINDIQSLEVLKDASATAIYGSRGANGVVLITTKSGRKGGGATVQVNTFQGISNVVQRLDLMTPSEFAEGVNFAEGKEVFTQSEISALRAGGGTDWQDLLFEEATFSNYQASVSGGNEVVDYFVSGNFYDADGTVINQNFKRYTLRANVNATVSDRLKIGLNTFGSRRENTGVKANLWTGLTYDPTTPAFDDKGEYIYTPLKPGIGNGHPNPLLNPTENIRENTNDQFLMNGYLSYSIAKGLELNVSAGMERVDQENNAYQPIIVNNVGNATVENRLVNRYQNTNRITYTNDNNPNHKFQIDAIHEQQLVKNNWTIATANGFFSDNTTYKNLSLGAIQRVQNETTDESLQSFLGRINYTLFDKFLLTASVRADGSSKFREDNRWGVFPSGSIAWRLSEEGFIKNSDAIDNLKLRLSYGVTGSQGIEALATRARPIVAANINYPFAGQAATIGVAPSNRLANPDLTWEQTAQTNVGVDLGLWNSKFTLSLDVYRKNTTDLLLDVFLPEFVGPTVVAQNIGEVENRGFDIRLGYTPIRNQNWVVTSILSLSRNVNEVLSLVDNEPIEKGQEYASGIPVNPTRVEVGQPLSAFRGYIFEGVYQLGEEAAAAEFGREPGSAKYRDVNGDGVISPDDIVTIGDGNPDLTWGWNWDISYKNFNLNFLVLGSHGNDIYNLQKGRMMALGATAFHPSHADYNDRWTPNNPSNVPSNRNGTELLSTAFLEDGSYITLKNMSLGYTFDNIGRSIGLDGVRLYLNAENLLLITDYSGFDPESSATGNSDVDLGIDHNNYPISRSFSLGLDLTF